MPRNSLTPFVTAPWTSPSTVWTTPVNFLGQLQSAASLTARFEEFSLGPMPLARVPQIIEGPARVAALSVEEAFVQQAARDAETEDALPRRRAWHG
jgi:hypothetical protein